MLMLPLALDIDMDETADIPDMVPLAFREAEEELVETPDMVMVIEPEVVEMLMAAELVMDMLEADMLTSSSSSVLSVPCAALGISVEDQLQVGLCDSPVCLRLDV